MRPSVRVAKRAEFPWLPVIVGGVFVLALIALFGYLKLSAAPVAAVQCDTGEQTGVHYHAHLDIWNGGTKQQVPQGIGINVACFYWLHTHNTDGVIHIEAPADQQNRTFTLGDFFDVWHQPLNSHQVGPWSASGSQTIKAWVNGKPWTGDLRSLPLRAHEEIAIEIVPPQVPPPSSFSWAPNL